MMPASPTSTSCTAGPTTIRVFLYAFDLLELDGEDWRPRPLKGAQGQAREHPYRSGPSKAWLKIKNPDALGVLRFKNDEP
jgi:ATP-dependent DNA ligase